MRTILRGYCIHDEHIHTVVREYNPQTEIPGINDIVRASEKADSLVIANLKQTIEDFTKGIFKAVMVCIDLKEQWYSYNGKRFRTHIYDLPMVEDNNCAVKYNCMISGNFAGRIRVAVPC